MRIEFCLLILVMMIMNLLVGCGWINKKDLISSIAMEVNEEESLELILYKFK